MKILIDPDHVGIYGQDRQNLGLLHQRDGGFTSLDLVGGDTGPFGGPGNHLSPLAGAKTPDMEGAPHDSRKDLCISNN